MNKAHYARRRMNKAYKKGLFTRLHCKEGPVYPAVGWIVGNLPGSRAKNIYSLGSE